MSKISTTDRKEEDLEAIRKYWPFPDILMNNLEDRENAEYPKCTDCGERKSDVESVAYSDIEEHILFEDLCGDCYDKRLEEI